MWDQVHELPDEILTNEVFAGGIMAIEYANCSLTYTTVQERVAQLNRCGDMTDCEQQLAELLQAELDEFNASWDFG